MSRKRKVKRYSATYKRKRVFFNHPVRKGICEGCGNSIKNGDIKVTDRHHWLYIFSVSQVKKQPHLALKNTVELDYYCHKIGESLRHLMENTPKHLNKIIGVANTMPKEYKDRMTKLCEEWLNQNA